MSDLVGNHIVGFPTRRLIYLHHFTWGTIKICCFKRERRIPEGLRIHNDEVHNKIHEIVLFSYQVRQKLKIVSLDVRAHNLSET